MEMLQGVWKQHLMPRAVVGYGVKIFLPSSPNYVTRSPGSKWSEGDVTITNCQRCQKPARVHENAQGRSRVCEQYPLQISAISNSIASSTDRRKSPFFFPEIHVKL